MTTWHRLAVIRRAARGDWWNLVVPPPVPHVVFFGRQVSTNGVARKTDATQLIYEVFELN
jgi:hypothetical protein